MPRKKRGNITRSDMMFIDTEHGRVLFKINANNDGMRLRVELINNMYQGIYDITCSTNPDGSPYYRITPAAYGCSATGIKLNGSVQSTVHELANWCFKPGILFNNRLLQRGSKQFSGSCSLVGYVLPMQIKIILDDGVAQHLWSKTHNIKSYRSLRRIVADVKYDTTACDKVLDIKGCSLPHEHDEDIYHDDYNIIHGWAELAIKAAVTANDYNIKISGEGNY